MDDSKVIRKSVISYVENNRDTITNEKSNKKPIDGLEKFENQINYQRKKRCADNVKN